jgi:hypothetical protein
MVRVHAHHLRTLLDWQPRRHLSEDVGVNEKTASRGLSLAATPTDGWNAFKDSR